MREDSSTSNIRYLAKDATRLIEAKLILFVLNVKSNVIRGVAFLVAVTVAGICLGAAAVMAVIRALEGASAGTWWVPVVLFFIGAGILAAILVVIRTVFKSNGIDYDREAIERKEERAATLVNARTDKIVSSVRSFFEPSNLLLRSAQIGIPIGLAYLMSRFLRSGDGREPHHEEAAGHRSPSASHERLRDRMWRELSQRAFTVAVPFLVQTVLQRSGNWLFAGGDAPSESPLRQEGGDRTQSPIRSVEIQRQQKEPERTLVAPAHSRGSRLPGLQH